MRIENIWAIIAGAGVGSRFGGSIPKQYAHLDGKTVAYHSIQRLIDTNLFEKIIIVLDRNDCWFKSISLPKKSNIEIVYGGNSRAKSVRNGLLSLGNIARPNDWILVHDIVRPLVTTDSIERLFSEVSEQDVAAILASSIDQTIKKTFNKNDSEKKMIIDRTLDRNKLWAAQTPQIVRYEILCKALDKTLQSGMDVTDEAMAVEKIGEQVVLVSNTSSNIKITTQDDMSLAEYLYFKSKKSLS